MTDQTQPVSRKDERRAFIFLTAVLIPLLSITIVGGFGLIVWLYQMIAGPPTG